MRERSKQQHSLDEGDKDTVWKVTLSHWPCRWPSLLAAPLPWARFCKSLFGTGFTGWLFSGFLVVHTRHHHQQSLSRYHHCTHQPPPSPLTFPSIFSSPPLSAGYYCERCYSNASTFPNLLPSVRPSGPQCTKLQTCSAPLPVPSTYKSWLMCYSKVHVNMWLHP